jgi:hypothetical protein
MTSNKSKSLTISNSNKITASFWDPNTQSETTMIIPNNEPKRIPYLRHGHMMTSQFSIEDMEALINRVKALEEALIEQHLLGSKDE